MDSLKLLETKIDQMLAQHTKVCEERDRLTQEVAQAQARTAELAARARESEQERAEIKARIERILGRLDGVDLG